MLSVYCDGSSTGKSDKPGGWAFVIVATRRRLLTLEPYEVVLSCGYGGDPSTTNNRMELLAAIRGLEELDRLVAAAGCARGPAELVSDSQYTLNIACGAFSPQKNLDLTERLRALMVAGEPIDIRWVKGHSSNVWNSRCDSLAKKGKEEQYELESSDSVPR